MSENDDRRVLRELAEQKPIATERQCSIAIQPLLLIMKASNSFKEAALAMVEERAGKRAMEHVMDALDHLNEADVYLEAFAMDCLIAEFGEESESVKRIRDNDNRLFKTTAVKMWQRMLKR